MLRPIFAESVEVILAGIVGSVITGCFMIIGLLWKRNLTHEKRQRWSDRRIGDLEGQLVDARVEVDRLTYTGDAGNTAIITVDLNSDMIVEWSPGATLMFNWMMKEALGKPPTIIVPERFREAFRAALTELKRTGGTPRRGPHYLVGLRRDLEEIAIQVTCSGWKAGDQHCVSAVMKLRRPDDPDFDVGSKPDEEDPGS